MKTRLFIVILLVISALPSMAMDTVIYRQPSSGAIAEQTGTVEQFLRDGLVITSASGQSKTIPAELVIEIKTARPDLYQQALIRMEQQDYEQALPLLEKTLSQIGQDWLQREVLTKQIECYCHLDKMEEASMRFALLIQTQPQTAWFTVDPLIWTSVNISPRMAQTAKSWTQQQKAPFVTLLGASWLLIGPEQKNAVAVLNFLKKSDDPIISILAIMQLNRINLASESPEKINNLKNQIDKLPLSMQFGPRYILGQMWGRIQKEEGATDKSVINYLQCAENKKTPHPLQARSLYLAGSTLLSAGNQEEAFRIFTRLIQKFPTSDWSQQAKRTADGKL